MGRISSFTLEMTYYLESYKRCMEDIKRAEQLTPKEYGMRLQGRKKKRKVIKRGK